MLLLCAACREPPIVPHLPDPALSTILQFMPRKQRMQSCALVCKRWAAAAVAATTDITATLYDYNDCEELQKWLGKNGSQVESLKLKSKTRMTTACASGCRCRYSS